MPLNVANAARTALCEAIPLSLLDTTSIGEGHGGGKLPTFFFVAG